MKTGTLVDHHGNPLSMSGRARRELPELQPAGLRSRRTIAARYDAASDSDEFRNYWANADRLDADSAHAPGVRARLVARSRYEVGNNGFADGMVQTYATDVVGVGPKLRMQTKDKAFNQAVERQWLRWCKAVQFRRKLWCQAHAKVQDGEAFGILRTNPLLAHPVKLDYVLVETEQCATPLLPHRAVGYVDGIKFDAWGNPVWYDILPYHPGGLWGFAGVAQPEHVPARFVTHWFLLRRPGQHRAVPEFRSTLQVGASSRRWREATVASAETAADLSVVMQTRLPPDNEADDVAPLSTVDFQKRMLMAMPAGWEGNQMKAEHPNATYEAFHRAQINEQARPKSMPYNKAACDSSSYNYASGRLDHQTYYATLDVDREDGNDLVLDPVFAVWFAEAALVFGWDWTPGEVPDHSWDWPKHPVADVDTEASANDKKLRHGGLSLSRLYSEAGLDFEEEIEQMAADYGLPVDEMRATLRSVIFVAAGGATSGSVDQPAAGGTAKAPEVLEMAGGITGMLEIFRALAAGEISKETAIQTIVLFYQLTREEAIAVVADSAAKPPPAKEASHATSA